MECKWSGGLSGGMGGGFVVSCWVMTSVTSRVRATWMIARAVPLNGDALHGGARRVDTGCRKCDYRRSLRGLRGRTYLSGLVLEEMCAPD